MRTGLSPACQLRQLGDVGGDAPGLVAGWQLGRRAPTGLFLEIDVGERLTGGVADDEAPRSSSGSASSTDQGGGKRRLDI
jgi:hypothetical protein